MITLKSPAEIEKMAAAGGIVAAVLERMSEIITPGLSTLRMDEVAEKEILAHGGKPAFKGYRGFPRSICVSINNEVVHGIPSTHKIIHEGDIVGIDVGVLKDGFYGDGTVTLPVGTINEVASKLLRSTRLALHRGIEKALPENHLYDISAAIEYQVKKDGFSVVREYCGHGIGTAMHEEPQVPNYELPERGRKLRAGLVLALEPMVNQGGWRTKVLPDGWTVVTADGTLSAQFEHTVAITEAGPRILTAGLDEIAEKHLGSLDE